MIVPNAHQECTSSLVLKTFTLLIQIFFSFEEKASYFRLTSLVKSWKTLFFLCRSIFIYFHILEDYDKLNTPFRFLKRFIIYILQMVPINSPYRVGVTVHSDLNFNSHRQFCTGVSCIRKGSKTIFRGAYSITNL